MNGFVDSANSLKQYSDQTLEEMDLNIESKKKEYLDMINDMETKYTEKIRSLEREHTARTRNLKMSITIVKLSLNFISRNIVAKHQLDLENTQSFLVQTMKLLKILNIICFESSISHYFDLYTWID